MELSLSTHVLAGYTVLEASGEADVFTAQQLREYALNLIDGGSRKLIIDLSRLEFLGSAALGVIVGIHRRMHVSGGTMAIVGVQPGMLKLFSMTGLDGTLRLFDSVRAAIEAYAEPPMRPTPKAEQEAFQAKLEAIWRESVAAARKAAAQRPAPRRADPPDRSHGPRVDLTPAERAQIIDLYVKGKGILEVAEIFSVPDEFVWRLLRTQGLGPSHWP